MTEEQRLAEKALKYTNDNNVKISHVDVATEAYIAGYRQAQQDNNLHWRDPRKELPEPFPSWMGEHVLAAVDFGDCVLTKIVEYSPSARDEWAIRTAEKTEVFLREEIKAWMPLPEYRE